MNSESTAQIREFVEKIFAQRNKPSDFSNHESLFQSGRLSSLDAIQIIVFLENNFGLNFKDIGLDISMLDSVDRIVELIATKSR